MADTNTNPKPFPTTLVVSVGCGLLTAVWLYLQLRVWREEGHDQMLMAANILVSMLLWSFLGWAVYRNLKDARRAENLSAQIVALKDEHELELKGLKKELALRPPIPPWGGYRSAEEQRRSVDEQNRLLNIGRSADGLFSPLQIRIFAFRKRLLDFLAQCGPFPEPPDAGDRVIGLEWSNKFVSKAVAWAEAYSAWARKVDFGYREKFAPEILSIVNELGSSTSADVSILEPFTANLVPPEESPKLIKALAESACNIDSREIVDAKRQMKKLFNHMTADEILGAVGNPTFQKIMDEKYR